MNLNIEQIKQVIKYLEQRARMRLPLKILSAIIYLADQFNIEVADFFDMHLEYKHAF